MPIAKLLVNTNISATSVSLLSFLLGLLSCSMIISGRPYISVVFLFLSLIFDCVDEDLYRIRHKTTQTGYYLDGVLDRVMDSLLIISVIFYYPDLLFLGALLIFVTMLTAYIRRASESIGIKCNVGLLGRDLFLVSLITLILFENLINGLIFYGLIILIILSSITAVHRFIYTYNKSEV